MTLQFLKECFEINNSSPTGLVWRARPFWHFKDIPMCIKINKEHQGKQAGSVSRDGRTDKKYWMVRIKINGEMYRLMVHRIIYSLLNNIQLTESQEIDHKDGNGLNNNPKNIRLCTKCQNMQNRKKLSNNTSGYKGVSKFKGKYRAVIHANKEKIYLGTFNTIGEADEAYQKMAKILHKEFRSL